MISSQARAEQHEQANAEHFQFLMEQQCRQSKMFQYYMHYLYQATGVPPLQSPMLAIPSGGMPPQQQLPPLAPGSVPQVSLP